jgi:hypothetical protein
MSTIDELNKIKQELENRLEAEHQEVLQEINRQNQIKAQKQEATQHDGILAVRQERMMGIYNELKPLVGTDIDPDDVLLLLCAVLITIPESYAGGFVTAPTRTMHDFAEVVRRMKAYKASQKPQGAA